MNSSMKDYNATKKEATILFCDIRNFTTLFEEKDPLKAFQFANTVLATLGKEVEKMGGKVDRFTGDGFLAHFGVEGEVKNHAYKACKSALNMGNELREINKKRYIDVEEVVAMGAGIHTGEVAYGEIRTNQINQKTVMGDVVNTASRIEKLTKYFSVNILISQESCGHVETDFHLKKMPAKPLKGKQQKMNTYWLLPMNN